MWILQNDPTDLDLMFTIDEDLFGQVCSTFSDCALTPLKVWKIIFFVIYMKFSPFYPFRLTSMNWSQTAQRLLSPMKTKGNTSSKKNNTVYYFQIVKLWVDNNLLFFCVCVWQSCDAVEVCEQSTEADDCLQRGDNLLHAFMVTKTTGNSVKEEWKSVFFVF